jgi:phage tail protein X
MFAKLVLTTFTIVRLLVPGKLDLPVVQQPVGQYGYVDPNQVTQFQSANSYGSIGLLAHNDAAGEKFFGLVVGDVLTVRSADGRELRFIVTEIREYQAERPGSAYSNLIDLRTAEVRTAAAVFYETYGRSGALVLQTCIAKDGIANWGRLIIIAQPVTADAVDKRLK